MYYWFVLATSCRFGWEASIMLLARCQLLNLFSIFHYRYFIQRGINIKRKIIILELSLSPSLALLSSPPISPARTCSKSPTNTNESPPPLSKEIDTNHHRKYELVVNLLPQIKSQVEKLKYPKPSLLLEFLSPLFWPPRRRPLGRCCNSRWLVLATVRPPLSITAATFVVLPLPYLCLLLCFLNKRKYPITKLRMRYKCLSPFLLF